MHTRALWMAKTVRKNVTWSKKIKELLDLDDTCQSHKTTNNQQPGKIQLSKPYSNELSHWLMRFLKDESTRQIQSKHEGQREEVGSRENYHGWLFCLTMIDEVTGWTEIVSIKIRNRKMFLNWQMVNGFADILDPNVAYMTWKRVYWKRV